MKKIIVKLGFHLLTIPEKIQKARSIVSAITGNEHFKTPYPELKRVTQAIDALETAHEAALDGGKSRKATMYFCEDELGQLMINLAAYVQTTSDGNAAKVRSAGMEIRNNPTPIGMVLAPANMRSATNGFSGEIDVKWGIVRGAKAYVIEMGNDGVNWSICGYSTRAGLNVKGLTSLSYQWFRVAAIGSAGKGPWSDELKGLVG